MMRDFGYKFRGLCAVTVVGVFLMFNLFQQLPRDAVSTLPLVLEEEHGPTVSEPPQAGNNARMSRHVRRNMTPAASPDGLPILTGEWRGRLGNLMFLYAALLGIARRQGMQAGLPGKFPLRRFFMAPMKVIPYKKSARRRGYTLFEEQSPNMYDPATERLRGVPTITKGYFQSWKYFDDIRDEVKAHFQFRPRMLNRVREWMQYHVPDALRGAAVVWVAVHVRRGDRLHDAAGPLPGRNYLRHAMSYFRAKFSRVLFFVCSDDIEWCEANIDGYDVVFSRSNKAPMDLAIMTQCNHTIVTVGSFGWWAGYLAGGTVVYFKDWTPVGLFRPEDRYLPGWVGMTDSNDTSS